MLRHLQIVQPPARTFRIEGPDAPRIERTTPLEAALHLMAPVDNIGFLCRAGAMRFAENWLIQEGDDDSHLQVWQDGGQIGIGSFFSEWFESYYPGVDDCFFWSGCGLDWTVLADAYETSCFEIRETKSGTLIQLSELFKRRIPLRRLGAAHPSGWFA